MNNNKPTLVTSALPYVNNVPHLGNIIGSTLSGDVYTRYLRSKDKEVLYLCGTDEYGTTTEVKAKQENLSCQEICDKYHKLHKQVYDWFNIKFDVWGRTTTNTQTKITHEIFHELYKNNHIEEKQLVQKYCNNCKMFLADRFLDGICYHPECVKLMKDNKELIIVAHGDQCDKCHNLIDIEKLEKVWCSECKQIPEDRKTWHLYLKLGDFTDKLNNYFIKYKNCILTDNAQMITKSWINKDLESRCITRDLKWGTPFPDDMKDKCPELYEKYKDKVFYVWFDAPIGYLSILEHQIKDQKEINKWYSGDVVNFMAKDNVPFHTIIFPATLLGGGNNKYPLVTKLCSTEYLNYEGTKFSKSKNIGVFGDQIIQLSEKIGIDEDYWRYYLIRIRPETKDSNFSWTEFITLINGELCFKVGNLINRCISLVNKYFENQELIYNSDHKEFAQSYTNMISLIDKYDNLMSSFHFRDALMCALQVADYGNNLLQVKQPWNIQLKDKELAKLILTEVTFVCYILLKLFEPFIPRKVNSLLNNIVFDKKVNIYYELKGINGRFKIVNTDYKLPFVQLDKTKIYELLTQMNVHYVKDVLSQKQVKIKANKKDKIIKAK